ncbi:MAG: DUF1761 domain-containing protein [Algibacter sp.]|uniref:DUF1761 domain-containing protein n=1 Tax=Algibacter sp. TaxID=1872428 RepID=UPI002620803E|nr:DUF1761 domain-containing protein [Algibacter sp.]MDG1730496.1 DUF1761 domain-containing protein [Algibacter sp.]MDG2179718.1 DUF1761 domain-containing protein [Algibacter sp.]
MDFLNFPAILVAAVSALVVGFIWYNPKVFGNTWMKEAGMTDEAIKGGNMSKIFILAFIFAVLLAMTMMQMSIHQTGALSLIGGDASKALPSYTAFMADYGDAFRTYKHGALHGVLAGFFVALPIIGTNALFERKSGKYIVINAGYWVVTLGIMGAIVCGWK